MSFLMFAGCKYFGIILGDKRSSDNNGNVLDDNVEKVKRINSKLIIGFGGDETLIYVLQKSIFSFQPLESLSYEKCLSIINEKFGQLFPELNNHLNEGRKFSTSIGVSSNWNGIIEFAHIHINGISINIDKFSFVSDDDTKICCFASGLGGLGKKFEEVFLKYPVYSITNIKSTFYKVLETESKKDYTINNRFNCEYVIRKDIYDERKDKIKK